MKLRSIDIKNFKGISNIQHDFNGDDTTITAQNKSGKTTIYDAFLWLLFGKDSDGKQDFSVRPLNKNNEVQEKLVISVESEIEVYGQKYLLRKENKKSTNGYSNKFWVDSVPKKAGEYSSVISGICDEETFKMLTDLQYFNGKMHWQERRNVLLDLAGKDIAKPVGFDRLLSNMSNLGIDDYKKVITDRRKLDQQKLDNIDPRIDELQKALDDTTITDGLIDLEDEREQVGGEIATLDGELNEIRESNKQARQKQAEIDQQSYALTALETKIKTDKSHVANYTEEIGQIKKAQSERETELSVQKELIKRKEIEISTYVANISTQQQIKAKALESFTQAKDAVIGTSCYTCGQDLPDYMVDEVKEKKAKEVKLLGATGKGINALLKDLNVKKDTANTELLGHQALLMEYQANFNGYIEVDQKRIDKLQAIIDRQETPDHTQDIQWQALNQKIDQLKTELPKLDESKIDGINKERVELQELLAKADKAFAQKDTIERNRGRISELETEGKDLAQKITGLDGELEQIKSYKQAESDMIVKAVNGQFKYVSFKLFETQINGDIRPCCTALNNGVPYPDMSTGQKIQCGIDIVERLSEHYGKSMVLFIDNAESITLPIEHTGQTIKLVADKTVKTLEFTKG